jgi:hypothetical protein
MRRRGMNRVNGFINRHFGSVRVYTLAKPDVLIDNAQRIGGELFGMRDLRDDQRTFSIYAASGYLFYADYNELWQNTAGMELPMDKGEVEKIARGFLETANRKIVASRPLRQARVPALFPSDIRPIWIGRAVPGSSSIPDHWLCQFGVYLAADRERTGRVEGATIDLRIGRKGKVIGLSSRWRPITGDTLSSDPVDPATRTTIYADSPMAIRKPDAGTITPIAKPTALPSASEVSEQDADSPWEYLFWLADENAPQTFLAPVLLQRAGHEGEVEAASQHSLNAEIWQRNSGEQLEVLAVVDGGSGNYEYEWGYWLHDSVFDDGIQLMGNSQTASLDRGVYNVLLFVRDKLTGAVAQTEKVVFSGN